MTTGAQATMDNGYAASRHPRGGGAPTNRVPVAAEPVSGAAFTVPSGRHSTYVDRTCKKCGKPFVARTWEVRRGRGKVCSASCLKSAPAIEPAAPPVQLHTLKPGTRFRVETTEGEVVRQHPVCRETVVRYQRGGTTTVYSTWVNTVNVRVRP